MVSSRSQGKKLWPTEQEWEQEYEGKVDKGRKEAEGAGYWPKCLSYWRAWVIWDSTNTTKEACWRTLGGDSSTRAAEPRRRLGTMGLAEGPSGLLVSPPPTALEVHHYCWSSSDVRCGGGGSFLGRARALRTQRACVAVH